MTNRCCCLLGWYYKYNKNEWFSQMLAYYKMYIYKVTLVASFNIWVTKLSTIGGGKSAGWLSTRHVYNLKFKIEAFRFAIEMKKEKIEIFWKVLSFYLSTCYISSTLLYQRFLLSRTSWSYYKFNSLDPCNSKIERGVWLCRQ